MIFYESSISFGLYKVTRDFFFYVHAGYVKMIKNLFHRFNRPQYAIIVDASSLFILCCSNISKNG